MIGRGQPLCLFLSVHTGLRIFLNISEDKATNKAGVLSSFLTRSHLSFLSFKPKHSTNGLGHTCTSEGRSCVVEGGESDSRKD